MQILRLGTHNRKCNLNAIFSIFRVNAPETRPKTSQTTSTERRCLVVTRDRTFDRVNASRSRYVTVHRHSSAFAVESTGGFSSIADSGA